jgi:hypothetical protein
MFFQLLPMSANRALQEAHWLFFDLGNALVSEDAATECRIQRLVEGPCAPRQALFDGRGAICPSRKHRPHLRRARSSA